MQTSKKTAKTYALYNSNDELITVGTDVELAKFLGRKIKYLRSSLSRVRHGYTNTLISKEFGTMSIYEIED